MNAVLIALWVLGLAILAGGPIVILALFRSRVGKLPSALKFVPTSVVACSVAFWACYLAYNHVVELRFRELVGGGPWTETEVTRWNDDQRRAARAWESDGARNCTAVVVPLPLLVYSSLVWLIAWGHTGNSKASASTRA